MQAAGTKASNRLHISFGRTGRPGNAQQHAQGCGWGKRGRHQNPETRDAGAALTRGSCGPARRVQQDMSQGVPTARAPCAVAQPRPRHARGRAQGAVVRWGAAR
jgi:hypothetical protein